MDDLLNLITSNPILLFLIIGAILNFLQKGKNQDENKGPKRPPTIKGKKIEEVDWREIFRQESDEKSPPTIKEKNYPDTEQEPSVNAMQTNELMEQYKEMKRKKETIKSVERMESKSPIYKDDITNSKQVSLDFSNISKQEAIKGVVWSEILGKPRSKGSYRPSLNVRKKQG